LLRSSVADPGSGAFLGSRIRDEQPGSYFLKLRKPFFWVKILKFFDEHLVQKDTFSVEFFESLPFYNYFIEWSNI
jgi:hypothetical protein